MNPTNTVIVEVKTALWEYIAYISAVAALAKNPKIPEINKFLLSKIDSLYSL